MADARLTARVSFLAQSSDTDLSTRNVAPAHDHESTLSPAHRDYLLRRHGTVHLDPLPSADPADPYNWPTHKKLANLILVAFHAFMAVFTSSAIIPAFGAMAEEFDCSIQQISYLIAFQILVLGFAPFFWRPISKIYGRRQVWLVSTIMSALFNGGCSISTSYAVLMVFRCLVSFFISPALTLGSGVVVETFFKSNRGKCMGVWTALVTLGVPSGPLCMGFVADHLHFSVIFEILAIINVVQFILYIFFGPETLFQREAEPVLKPVFNQQYLAFGRIDATPLHRSDFTHPFTLWRYPAILIAAVSYSMVFGFCSVFLTVEIPHIFIPKFHFGPRQIGYQFIGLIVGTIFGEQLAGPLSDYWIKRQARLTGQQPQPEFRLWMSHVGFVTSILGLVIFCLATDAAEPDHWMIAPLLGSAVAAFGNQVVTTVLTTYAVDCYPEHSTSIGTFVNVVRQTWGFLGPFWFPQMIDGLGLSGSAGVMTILIILASIAPVSLLQWRGSRSPPDV